MLLSPSLWVFLYLPCFPLRKPGAQMLSIEAASENLLGERLKRVVAQPMRGLADSWWFGQLNLAPYRAARASQANMHVNLPYLGCFFSSALQVSDHPACNGSIRQRSSAKLMENPTGRAARRLLSVTQPTFGGTVGSAVFYSPEDTQLLVS